MNTNLQDFSHKRYNILTDEWVLVSPHRSKRPWQGQEEEISKTKRNSHDPNCFLCARNVRSNGEVNPDYTDVFVFTNDFAALQKDSPSFKVDHGLLKAESETGICKVICFSPNHAEGLADMKPSQIKKVISVWIQEYKNIGEQEDINYVQIFENKGAVMGCSNPHPHGQIWSQSTLPNEVIKKDKQQLKFYKKNQRTLLGDYLLQEIEVQERIIFENENFVVLVPFWAIWPFETMIIPKKQQSSIDLLSEKEQLDFAQTISILTKAYDKLFDCSFPYSSGIHQAPTNGKNNNHWHWHMSFYPPLLRSATVKKFMVGYEMFGSPQRDITPETAAEKLKACIE